MAKLEKRGDLHGVAVGYLLSGETDRARQYLTDLQQTSADVLSDEAAVALAKHAPEAALANADQALQQSPGDAGGAVEQGAGAGRAGAAAVGGAGVRLGRAAR